MEERRGECGSYEQPLPGRQAPPQGIQAGHLSPAGQVPAARRGPRPGALVELLPSSAGRPAVSFSAVPTSAECVGSPVPARAPRCPAPGGPFASRRVPPLLPQTRRSGPSWRHSRGKCRVFGHRRQRILGGTSQQQSLSLCPVRGRPGQLSPGASLGWPVVERICCSGPQGASPTLPSRGAESLDRRCPAAGGTRPGSRRKPWERRTWAVLVSLWTRQPGAQHRARSQAGRAPSAAPAAPCVRARELRPRLSVFWPCPSSADPRQAPGPESLPSELVAATGAERMAAHMPLDGDRACCSRTRRSHGV